MDRNKHYSLPPRSSPRPRNNSIISPDTQISSMSSVTTIDSPFQMMDIVVSVDILEGLIMELKDKNQSLASFESSSQSSRIIGTLPVTTFVSCKKNVSSTRTIATHVPSLPLNKPSSSHGGKHHHFLVRWPADYDPHGDALSTFKLSRLMKKESTIIHRGSLGFGYIPEEIELTIGLMRGSEMLTLGMANLVITGEETEEMIIDLPINVSKGAVKESKKTSKRSPSPLRKLRSPQKTGVKILKPKAFSGDPKRKYRLSEQSMIRLQVKITPQYKSACFGEEAIDERVNVDDYWNYDESTKRDVYDSTITEEKGCAQPEDINQQHNSKARAFGQELPQLTQDYICGQMHHREPIDTAYQMTKSNSFDPRMTSEIRTRDDPREEIRSTFNYSPRINVTEEEYLYKNNPSREMEKYTTRSSSRSSSRYRSDSQLRVGVGQHIPSGNRSKQRSVSQRRAGSQQRSGSRQRSNSNARERMSDVDPYPTSHLYERKAKNGNQSMRPSQHFIQNKSKFRDENRQPEHATNWFVENRPGYSHDDTSYSTPYPRTRLNSPNQSNRPPSRAPSYDAVNNYPDRIQHQTVSNNGYSQRTGTRRISSMR